MFEIRELTSFEPQSLLSLYQSVGWTNYTDHPDMLLRACAGSLLVLGAYDGAQLIGLLRAVGDGASILYIQDILVLPACRRQGVGRALLAETLARFHEVYQVVLTTDAEPRTIAFYQSLGFTGYQDMGCAGFLKMHT